MYQDIDYDEQISIKGNLVEQEIGIKPYIIRGSKDRFYKYRVVFQIKRVSPKNVALGYTLDRGFIYGVDFCPILRPKINDTIKPLNKILSSENISTWDPNEGKGKLLGITVMTNDENLIISLNVRRRVFLKSLTYKVLYEIGGVMGIWWVLKDKINLVIGSRGSMFLPFKDLKISPFGVYPDNLEMLMLIWESLESYKDFTALGTGLYFPLNNIETYVEKDPLVLREIEENYRLHYGKLNYELTPFMTFIYSSKNKPKNLTVNTDRFNEELPEDFGKTFVLIGSRMRKMKKFLKVNDLKIDKVYLFDTDPHTDNFTLVVISHR